MSVDTALRFVLVGLHLVTVAGGFMTAIGLGWTTRIFTDKCVLYSDMHISASKNSSVTLNYEDTEWGNINVCYYCTFSTGVASIYAIIWFWFYFLLSEWDETNTIKLEWSLRMLRNKRPTVSSPPDSRLLFPTLFLNVVLWVCVAISLGLITKGCNIWCKSILSSLNQPCSYLSTVEWLNVQDGELSYTYIRIAQAGNWILLFSILSKILVVSCRVFLYLKRDPGRIPSPTRHNTSLAAKYVSFTEEQRRQLEHLQQLSDDDDERFRDIPFVDSEGDDIKDDHNEPERKHLLNVSVEKSYQNKSYSSQDSGPLQSSSTAQFNPQQDNSSSEENNLLNDQSFKYNTL